MPHAVTMNRACVFVCAVCMCFLADGRHITSSYTSTTECAIKESETHQQINTFAEPPNCLAYFANHFPVFVRCVCGVNRLHWIYKYTNVAQFLFVYLILCAIAMGVRREGDSVELDLLRRWFTQRELLYWLIKGDWFLANYCINRQQFFGWYYWMNSKNLTQSLSYFHALRHCSSIRIFWQ